MFSLGSHAVSDGALRIWSSVPQQGKNSNQWQQSTY